jgi:hypothetical protein
MEERDEEWRRPIVPDLLRGMTPDKESDIMTLEHYNGVVHFNLC